MKKYVGVFILYFSLCGLCRSQVPVSQEPRHHNVLENDHVRLLDVHIPPGDTTMLHIHATPSLFIVLKNVKTGSEVISEEDHSDSPIPHFGDIWFEGFYEKPRVHRVWNSDTTEFNVMDVELASKNHVSIDQTVKSRPFHFLFDNQMVRAYRLILLPESNVSVASGNADVLMILTNDLPASVQVNEKEFRKRGDFLYIHSETQVSITSRSEEEAVFAYFELK